MKWEINQRTSLFESLRSIVLTEADSCVVSEFVDEQPLSLSIRARLDFDVRLDHATEEYSRL